MSNNEKKKIAFFFGAGAESKESNYMIRSGIDYKKQTLLLEKKDASFTDNLYNKFKIRESFPRDKMKYGKDSALLSTNSDIYKKVLKNNFQHYFGQKKASEYISNGIYLKEFVKLLNEDNNNKKPSSYKSLTKLLKEKIEIQDFKNEAFNLGYGGILDSYFYTIINPVKLGKIKFSKVFNFYWACYFCIIEDIVRYYYSKNLLESDYLIGKSLNYKKVLNKIKDFTKMLYETRKKDTNNTSYYYFLNKALTCNSKILECSGIITTNYFDFVKTIEIDEKLYSFPNGRLDLFEFPEYLEVTKVDDEGDFSGKELFFPFIFGQSHVKPIVHQYQIEEFSKMKTILDSSDILVILGQGICEDDNHINSFIHGFIHSGKKVIYVSDKNEEVCRMELYTKLRLKPDVTSNIYPVKVKYNDIKCAI